MSRKQEGSEMDTEQVRKTVEQLVESEYDRRQALTRGRDFQDTNKPPLAPREFEGLEAFLDFYERQQRYEQQEKSFESERTNAEQRYEEARFALSRVLPTNALLRYTYGGDHEELKGQRYDIMNVSSAGRGQIRIAPSLEQS
jgi:hypothetical protein